VTESRDIGEARDVLEAALARDRADVPALTQRRRLAEQSPPERVVEPTAPIPEWVASYRSRLIERRSELIDDLAKRAERRHAAGVQLALIQPELAAARAAWQPYAECIEALEWQLQSELQPALRRATYDLDHAGFGHRHGAQCRAGEAAVRVDEAHAAIAAVHTDCATIEERFVTLSTKAAHLNDVAHPSTATYSLDDLDRADVRHIDEIVAAIDTWSAWSNGHRVAAADLVDAVIVLSGATGYRLPNAGGAEALDQSRWHEMLEPVVELLRGDGLLVEPDAGPEIERGGMAIEL
jgi:hypothetical protein